MRSCGHAVLLSGGRYTFICKTLNNFLILINVSAILNITVMKKTITELVICVVILAFAGCAPVQIYSNSGLSSRTGLKYYTVKPFLHVEREAGTNRIVKATVVYLPDLANPQYMVMHDGLNSRKVNIKFTDGTINTFGYSSTSKVPESVDALASMITKSTDAITELKSVNALQPAKAPSNTVELYEILIGEERTTLRKVEVAE